MKRLLCLVSAMNAGGAETFLMKLYRQLDKTKYQMDFCVNIFEEGYYDEEIRRLGGKIYQIPSKSSNAKEFSLQLRDIVSKEGYEYVLRITSNALGFMDLKIAKKAGAKVCVARSSNSSDGGSLKFKIAHLIGKFLYGRYIDVKIAPSDLAARYTFGNKAYKNGDVKILHNAIDLSVYYYDENGRDEVRREFGISSTTSVIGHVGRFSRQKNHEFLMRIFNEIHKQNSDTVLLLVGKGELKEQIEELANEMGLSDCVLFAGVRADIPKVLSAMDVFVFPSFYEGMPNTVIEAQATGLPCVISQTITKEADVANLVYFESLEENAETWAQKVMELAKCKRIDAHHIMLEKKYDIGSSVEQFVDYIFKNK